LEAGVGPNIRALWELWIEWRYFLRQRDRGLCADKVILQAKLEFIRWCEKRPVTLNIPTVASLPRRLREFELQHPQASAEIKFQRQKGKFHWSGKSRAAIERELAGGDNTAYEFFSWDAHAVMRPIRDVSIDIRDGVATLSFGRQQSERDVELLDWTSGGVLFYMYNDFANLWGLPPVVLPKTEAE
jgi:hypothetical protein